MTQWIAALRRELYGVRGSNDPALNRMLEKLDDEGARALLTVVRELRDEKEAAERKLRRGY
jgi:hypothetical protein